MFEIKVDEDYYYDTDVTSLLSVLSRNGYTLTITPIKYDGEYSNKNALMIEIGEIDESFSEPLVKNDAEYEAAVFAGVV
jgi:hypothetical protein